MYKALTIAGMDTCGSAGIQADLKTFQEFGVYGMHALTAIITQNPRNDWSIDLGFLALSRCTWTDMYLSTQDAPSCNWLCC